MKIENHTRTKANYCPSCKHLLDTASPTSDKKKTPAKGDITVCAYCAHLMVFNEDLTVRTITAKELEDLPEKMAIELGTVQATILIMAKERKLKKLSKEN